MPQKNSANVDLGLAVLSAVNRGEVAMTQHAIAEVCGCDKRTIQRIEERALKRVKIRLMEIIRQETA